MNQLLKSVTALAVLALCACTGRSTNTGTSPAPQPAQPESQQPSGEPSTQQTDQTQTDGNEQITPTQTGDQTTNDDVIDPATPTTTTPETTTTPSTTEPVVTPPTTNPTGTVNIQGSDVTFQDLKFTVPSGWKLHQDAISDGTLIMAFSKGTDYFRIYAKQGAMPSMQSLFVNGSQVVGQERDETIAGRSWKRIDTQKGQIAVAGFGLTQGEHTYFGFGRSSTGQAATAIAAEFLGSIKQ